MKYLLLGAGMQGTAIAFDLLRHAEGTAAVTVVDGDTSSLDRLESRLDDPRASFVVADVRDEDVLRPLVADADVVVSAVNYWYNAALAALAVDNQAHFVDLGGNNDIVAEEFALDERARNRGVTIMPDCGLAPGLAGILGMRLADGLQRVESLKLRVGGLPVHPRPPMNYKLVFSAEGLINEYIEPSVVIRDGKSATVPSLSELETVVFPEPFGELEAFQTSGGVSTLPTTLAGRVSHLDYKTIRYKGHCAQVRLLRDLGLTEMRPIDVDGVRVGPRRLLARLLETKLDLPGEDVVLVLIVAEGRDADGRPRRRTIRIVDHHDTANDISAMMRMTGYPTAIIARMLASGEIAAPGTRRQEEIVPGDGMVSALKRRGVVVEESEGRPLDPA